MSQQHGSQGMPVHGGQFPIGVSLSDGIAFGGGFPTSGTPLFMPDPVHLPPGHNPLLSIRDFPPGQIPPSLLVGHQLSSPTSMHHSRLIAATSGEQPNQMGSMTTTSSSSYGFSPGLGMNVPTPDSSTGSRITSPGLHPQPSQQGEQKK